MILLGKNILMEILTDGYVSNLIKMQISNKWGFPKVGKKGVQSAKLNCLNE